MNDYNGFTPAERNRAQRWINKHLEAHLIQRPVACCACGAKDCIIDFHCEDYNEPYGPQTIKYPLCYVCHLMVHCRFKSPKQWKRYLEDLRVGKIFPLFKTRSWERFKELFLVGTSPFTMGPPRPVLPFDTMGLDRKPLALTPIVWPRPVKVETPKMETPTFL